MRRTRRCEGGDRAVGAGRRGGHGRRGRRGRTRRTWADAARHAQTRADAGGRGRAWTDAGGRGRERAACAPSEGASALLPMASTARCHARRLPARAARSPGRPRAAAPGGPGARREASGERRAASGERRAASGQRSSLDQEPPGMRSAPSIGIACCGTSPAAPRRRLGVPDARRERGAAPSSSAVRCAFPPHPGWRPLGRRRCPGARACGRRSPSVRVAGRVSAGCRRIAAPVGQRPTRLRPMW
jgi:hypothetical protein